jgi:PTH1 family peptidyl-tRNA hydrolase
MSVDKVATNLGVTFDKTKCRAEIAQTNINGQKVIIAKPVTYMNLSGESVRELMSFFKIPVKDLMVIYDDFDLFQGAVRIRENGSAGTHNGMRNILKEIGSGEFSRIRIGFKPKTELKIPLINFVLSGISEQDKPIFDKTTTIAEDAATLFAKGETVQNIMCKFNGSI